MSKAKLPLGEYFSLILNAQVLISAVTSANAASPSDEMSPVVNPTSFSGKGPPDRSLRAVARHAQFGADISTRLLRFG
jgi:hypothetical protein